MPANKDKSCRLCGSRKHTLATCTLRGAAEFRKLLKSGQGKPRKPQSRVCRGSGVAADRKKCRKPGKKPKSAKAYKTVARKHYSGDVPSNNRLERQRTLCVDWNSPLQALEELQRLGFLQPPGRCGTCRYGSLAGPFPRHDAGTEGSLYYRCTNWECKKYTNALSLQTWLPMSRYGSLTPTSLLGIIKAYTSKTYPRPHHAWPLVPCWQCAVVSKKLKKLSDMLPYVCVDIQFCPRAAGL